MNAGPIQYLQVSNQIVESWAVALSWFVSQIEYNDRGIGDYGLESYSPNNPPRRPCQYAYQYWNLSIDKTYTSLFINIVDDFNERNQNFPTRGTGEVDDNVTGYFFADIEKNILKHSYGITSLRNKLIEYLPSGVSVSDLDLLLSHYQ